MAVNHLNYLKPQINHETTGMIKRIYVLQVL